MRKGNVIAQSTLCSLWHPIFKVTLNSLLLWLAAVFSCRGGVWFGSSFFICQFKSFFSLSVFSKSWHRVCPSWWNTDDDVSGGFIFAVQTTEWQRKQCNLSKGKATAINSIFITVMFPYCRGGGLLSSAEWYISPPHPCISPWLWSPVTAMIRERWDEYVRRDLILLNATSPVNSCQFCHCRFQAVSRLCGGGGEQHQKAWSFQQLHVIELSLTP